MDSAGELIAGQHITCSEHFCNFRYQNILVNWTMIPSSHNIMSLFVEIRAWYTLFFGMH